ncbi:hypothetical protein [Streptomyces sp. Wb2n-11]|uniref:hypothetical protein n=1 Tax=Streptomyces sp. Wb2n-11 TaxID=1030533 RepID=UPI000AEE0B20|nr:hypothetical protein [Streptomyces sp. Wb2n-11]
MKRPMNRTVSTATTLFLTTAACLAVIAPTATAAETDYACDVIAVTGADRDEGLTVSGWECDPVPGGDPGVPVIVADNYNEYVCERVSLQGRNLTATGCH